MSPGSKSSVTLGSRARPALLVVSAWTLVGLGVFLQDVALASSSRRPPPGWSDALFILEDVWIWAAYTPAIVWLARRFPLDGGGWRRHAPIHAAAALGIAVLDAALGRLMAAWLRAPAPAPALLLVFERTVLLSVYSYLAVLALGHALRFRRLYLDRRLAAAELERQLAETRLGALEAQLRPHFLFNALHTVASLVRAGDSQGAVRTIAGLGDLLRAALQEGGQEVTLREELALTTRYLEIERTRHRDRLETAIEVDPGALDALVPRFLLQPVVENAVRHGVEPVAGPGRVEVRAARSGASLRLEVRDSGPGPQAAGRPGQAGSGVGLRNTRARLWHLYGAAQRLDLEAAPGGGTVVVIELPWRAGALAGGVA